MDVVRSINDVSVLYEGGVVEENGVYSCPVCNKEFKSLGWAQKHVDKQDCYDMRSLFSGTEHELKGYELFKSIVSESNQKARVNLSIFKKSKSYSPILRFILFCTVHEIKDIGLYYSWISYSTNNDMMNFVLSHGIKEQTLRDHRIFLLKNEEYVNSESFYMKYRDDLLNDGLFFIRSIEKAHIGIKYLSTREDFPFDGLYDMLDLDYYERLINIVDIVEGN